jgi:hypothetical protein
LTDRVSERTAQEANSHHRNFLPMVHTKSFGFRAEGCKRQVGAGVRPSRAQKILVLVAAEHSNRLALAG